MPPQPVWRHARRNHPGVPALSPVWLYRHAHLCRELRHHRRPAAGYHRAGLWRQTAHLHHRRCHQRQKRAAVSHRLHQQDQDGSDYPRQKGVSHRPRAGAVGTGAHHADRGYIREHIDQKTKRASRYRHDGKRLAGFNSLFACASIDAAKRYYAKFAEQKKTIPEAQWLKVGLIYSFAVNEEASDGILGEEEFETEGLDASSRDFLDAAIQDYNA